MSCLTNYNFGLPMFNKKGKSELVSHFLNYYFVTKVLKASVSINIRM